ncbi:Sensor protein ZraS [Thauera sp. GDN1]|uniref:ATP-binding protein n=1 Tax=Thauera sp. GDN1 TaxID=2944810 RepID=UPI00247A5752|nr:ATP-binding protein [Thauera sp. GDN1]WEN40940.1 Sensor protein ZraS [Thauera sp. GDN1]
MPTPTFSAFELQPLPDGASAILHVLAAQGPDWSAIARIAARDPALSLGLLVADPLAPGELEKGLDSAFQRRLERIGPDLLRAWLLAIGHVGEARDEPADKALLRAECALRLAIEADYPRPDEAYLAGLWRDLVRSTGWNGGVRPPITALVAACGLPPSLADALETGGLTDERLAAAHPLLALTEAADRLATTDWQQHVARAARLSGLEASTVLSLRSAAGDIVSDRSDLPPAPAAPLARPALRLAEDPYRCAGVLGLLTAAFVDLDGSAIGERLAIAGPLFGLHTPSVLLGSSEDGRLQPLLTPEPDSVGSLIAELRLRVDDEASCIALSARSQHPTSFYVDAGGPGRSMADWQIARWLGHTGFHVLPLAAAEELAVALVGAASAQALDGERSWRYAALLGAAARALRTYNRQRNEITAREAVLRQRFRDHVRKIVHEATNPLAVLKSRTGMLAQEREDDMLLQDEMSLLGTELDRIDTLLRGAANLPVETGDVRHCRVPELLLDMRVLYGDALFASRGIQLELRTARDVPPAAIPASALKQVLLNLFRNASEALQPGQRLVVSVFPQVNVDGRNCIEIRFVDNGPGLPPERAHDPLSAAPSTKGDGHQGLGLSVVREILAQWDSTLLCRTQKATGTSFQIFIPLEQRA